MSEKPSSKTADANPLSLADIDLPDTRFGHLRHHLFISYSRADESAAAELYRSLPELNVFFAPENLPRPGGDDERTTWFHPIEQALFSSCNCVCLVSRSYLQRSWCLLEMHGFFNISRDNPRRQWLYPLEEPGEALPAKFSPLVFPGSLAKLTQTLQQACTDSPLEPGDMEPGAPLAATSSCFRGLPLERLYGNQRRPWRADGRGPAMPIGPDYANYEALVREYMVKILRGTDAHSVWLNPPDMDGRAKWVAEEARGNAIQLIEEHISPFLGTRSGAELLAEIRQARHQGQHEPDLDCLEGTAQLMAGDHANAIQSIERGLQNDPAQRDSEQWLCQIAMARYCLKDYGAALETLAHVDTPSAQTLLIKAACLARTGKVDAARRSCREAVNLDPAMSLEREAFDLILERNEDAAHWLDGLRSAGLHVRA